MFSIILLIKFFNKNNKFFKYYETNFSTSLLCLSQVWLILPTSDTILNDRPYQRTKNLMLSELVKQTCFVAHWTLTSAVIFFYVVTLTFSYLWICFDFSFDHETSSLFCQSAFKYKIKMGVRTEYTFTNIVSLEFLHTPAFQNNLVRIFLNLILMIIHMTQRRI